MRMWNVDVGKMCNQHLLGEHNEIHAIWSIINNDKKGYSNHPEVNRWRGKLKSLFLRHELLVREMEKRGYSHQSHLDKRLAKGKSKQNTFLISINEQKKLLTAKPCGCLIK